MHAHDIVERQAKAMRRRARCDRFEFAGDFAYVTGYPSPTQSLMRWRHCHGAGDGQYRSILLVVDMKRAPSGRNSHRSISQSGAIAFDAMKVLADLLQRRGLAGARIGIELDHLPASRFCRTEKPGAVGTLRAGAGAAARLRQIKTGDEIDLLRRLSRIADRSIAEAYTAVGPRFGNGPGGGAHPRPSMNTAPSISSSAMERSAIRDSLRRRSISSPVLIWRSRASSPCAASKRADGTRLFSSAKSAAGR